MLPNRITLSKTATDKLRYMKKSTGLTPNILARIAIMLAIKDGSSLKNSNVTNTDGQVLSNSVLFGEHSDTYEVLINQYVYDYDIEFPTQTTISALIECGVHKMGHVRNLIDLCDLQDSIT